MKKQLITATTAILLLVQLQAGGLYDQLCEFNPNWGKYAIRSPKGERMVFNSDREYIQTRLLHVLRILHENPTDQLSDAQQQQRTTHLLRLTQYREAGNFPLNYYKKERIPVFIDEHGTHCAVGYLMQQSGYEHLAQRLAGEDNYIWVKDIKDPEVILWQQESGLTLEELKLIQGTYDNYLPNAWLLPNKIEVPQKPEVIVRYFDTPRPGKVNNKTSDNIWVKGEGSGGVLNGKWIQYQEAGKPWIIGYYSDGQRTGQWAEYYQGTAQLCRTENWRNDKLNGIRTRYDRQGRIIEEIVFKEGKAVKKTNYTLNDSLTWIRIPIDSNIVKTEVYNYEGLLIASGKERIHNAGNLQWFQNIELTALNTMFLPSAEISPIYSVGRSRGAYYPGRPSLFETPPLVNYLKEERWVYYREYNYQVHHPGDFRQYLKFQYRHFANELLGNLLPFTEQLQTIHADSIEVIYQSTQMNQMYARHGAGSLNLKVEYYENQVNLNQNTMYLPLWAATSPKTIKSCGEVDATGAWIGFRKHYNVKGHVYKTENYLIAWREVD